MIRFLPINKREKFATKFEWLKQTFGMPVTEYKEQFTKLSIYTLHLVSTETMKIKRFVRGLADPLFSNLFLMVGRMSYAEVMDAAYGLESGRKEWKVRCLTRRRK